MMQSDILIVCALLVSAVTLAQACEGNPFAYEKAEPAKPALCGGIEACRAPKRCVKIDGKPKCRCKLNCSTKTYEPVCGSDGRTYENACALATARKCQERNVRALHRGKCRGNERVDKSALVGPPLCGEESCPAPKICSNSDGVPDCHCDTVCPRIYKPVCGSDGRSYGNTCELIKLSRCAERDVQISHEGNCITPFPVRPRSYSDSFEYGADGYSD